MSIVYPSPYLVITGMTYLLPAWLAYEKGFHYSLVSSLCLTATTMLYHWFHYDYLLVLDTLAVANYCVCSLYNIYHAGPAAVGVWGLSVGYTAYVYFIGNHLSILAWDPHWPTRMFFHGLIHFSTAYTAWYCFTHRQSPIPLG